MTYRLSVVGLGKLGACMAACFASKGHDVIGVDVFDRPVDLINEGKAPTYEPDLDRLMLESGGRLRATRDFYEAIEGSDITFIVVPTPSTADGAFSVEYVVAAGREIGLALAKKDGYHLVCLTSTVLPGATEAGLKAVLEEESGKRCGSDFGLCYSPEFIALGSVIRDFLNPDFVLIGEDDERAGAMLEKCMRATLERDCEIARMSIVNAELTKLSINTFLTTKIAFANMLATACSSLPGGDVDVVARAVGLDSRIGGKYLMGGMPFGGPCFPRDTRAMSHLLSNLGLAPTLPDAVHAANDRHLDEIVERVSALTAGAPVAVLGLTYKPGSVVLDASPGLGLALELQRRGHDVRVFEPLAAKVDLRGLPQALAVTDSLAEAVAGAEAVVLANPEKDLRSPEAIEVLRASGARLLFDCWRLLDGHAASLDPVRYIPLGRALDPVDGYKIEEERTAGSFPLT